MLLQVQRLVFAGRSATDGPRFLEFEFMRPGRHFEARPNKAGLLGIDFVFLVEEREMLGTGPDGFGVSEEQKAAVAQGIVVQGHDAALECWSEVNEHVSAADQVEI